MTSAQRRLWLTHQLDPSNVAYSICLAIELNGPLRLTTLRTVVDRIGRRHEAFRAVFEVSDGQARQRFDCPPAPLQLIDLPDAGLTSATDNRFARALREIAAHPFRLDVGPPLCWMLLRGGHEHHVLVLWAHHILFDAGSLAVVCHELESAYRAYLAGCPDGLSACGPRYGLLAEQEERLLGDKELLSGKDTDGSTYWAARLAGAPARTSPFPIAPSHRCTGAVQLTVHHRLEQLEPMAALARAVAATTSVVLLAALAAVISRYAGQRDVVLGSPITLRDDPERAGVVGLLINPVPLRVQLDGRLGFCDLLARCRDTLLDALDHRLTPFEQIVQQVAAARDPSSSPLFQVMLIHQQWCRAPEFPGVRSVILPVPSMAAKYELTVTVTESETGLSLTFEADPDVCDAAELSELADNMWRLLSAAVDEPTTPVEQLPLSTDGKTPALAAEIRAASVPPVGELVHDRIERTARAKPDSVAVASGRRHLTYRTLIRRSAALAAQLRRQGCGPERLVGILLTRTPELIVTVLAVLRAGAAYLPLDPTLPAKRLRLLLADSGAHLLVTERALSSMLDLAPVPVHEIDAAAWPAGPMFPAPASHPKSLAYVLYTSGSTGRPKGVAVQHDSLAAFAAWARDNFTDDELAAVLATTSLGFDLSVFELFATLACGGTIVLAADVPQLREQPWLAAATLLNTVPSAAEALAGTGGLPPSLLTLNLCGEPLHRDLVDRVHARLPSLTVRNLYGPAEATVYATSTVVPPGDASQPPIGTSISPACVWVGDQQYRPAPGGAIGELFIGGVALARGYLHRAGLTADRFRPNPFSPPGGRLYRTGDLARLRGDGRTLFVGRVDTQVKVRGVRIELGEVEVALRQAAPVREAAVVRVGDTPATQRLVGYITPADGKPIVVDSLLAELRQRLPAAAVPARVVVLDALPLNVNGKVDRREVARMAATMPDPALAPTAPRTELERRIAQVWCAVLGLDTVGVHEGFFDVGGNSMLVISLHRLLVSEVSAGLRLVDLFRFPSVASLAGHLGDRDGAGNSSVAAAMMARAQRRRLAAASAGRSRPAVRGT